MQIGRPAARAASASTRAKSCAASPTSVSTTRTRTGSARGSAGWPGSTVRLRAIKPEWLCREAHICTGSVSPFSVQVRSPGARLHTVEERSRRLPDKGFRESPLSRRSARPRGLLAPRLRTKREHRAQRRPRAHAQPGVEARGGPGVAPHHETVAQHRGRGRDLVALALDLRPRRPRPDRDFGSWPESGSRRRRRRFTTRAGVVCGTTSAHLGDGPAPVGGPRLAAASTDSGDLGPRIAHRHSRAELRGTPRCRRETRDQLCSAHSCLLHRTI